jgi:tripartite-type tricarboxylate transporter receptor subunit TctC
MWSNEAKPRTAEGLRMTRGCTALIAIALCLVRPAYAQPADVIDRPVTITVAGTAGGGIDLYARLLARHLGRHIPGHPTVTVQTMPGAGGIRAAYHLAQVAPRDGTALATFASGPILEPLIGARHPGYDTNRLAWIGAMTRDVGLCLSLGSSRFKTIDDARKGQMIVAGTGAGSETDTWPLILNDLLGTKIKVVTGYLGSRESILAIERGEADGRCTISLSALKTAKPDWLTPGKVNLLLQVGLEKSGEFPDVPLIFDLLSREEDRQMVSLLVAPTAMARAFAAPPGVPPARTALMRRAFDATMKDAEFLAEAARMQADVAPTTGEEVEALVAGIYATPRPVIERVKKYFAP